MSPSTGLPHAFSVREHKVTHTHTHTCKHTCRVWAMQYNKQRGSDVVSFAPCAIVEKPHEGFWVLKDKPWLAGRESVMQQENCFSPFFPPFSPPLSFLLNLFLFTPLPKFCLSPNSLSVALPTFFSSSFISFILWHIRLSCNTLQLKMLRPLECSVKEVGGPGGAGQTSTTN